MAEERFDVAVVGGGLGGLTAAALLARRGLNVVVLERASTLGGRGATHVRDGFHFNEGAHALYRAGAAARTLCELGVRWTGRTPPSKGVAELGGRAYGLPVSVGSLLTTGLLTWGAKVGGARLLGRIGSVDVRQLRGVPFRDWLESQIQDQTMRAMVEALVRVTTYVHASPLLDAAAVIEQLRLAQGAGVAYVDGGWQTLVDGVAGAARQAGASLRVGAPVRCATRRDGAWCLSLGDQSVEARALVLATGPATARSVVASDALAAWADEAIPARAACLDVALSRLPDPRTVFALAIDRPLYFSVHSRTARLAPEGAALVCVMKYLAPGHRGDAAADLADLEGWLDRLQAGWREAEVGRRWLPAMVATNAVVTAASGGKSSRPEPRVPDVPDVYVVGDWVGDEGMLLDASLASAGRAAGEVAQTLALAKVA